MARICILLQSKILFIYDAIGFDLLVFLFNASSVMFSLLSTVAIINCYEVNLPLLFHLQNIVPS
jgi:hypothetical protein